MNNMLKNFVSFLSSMLDFFRENECVNDLMELVWKMRIENALLDFDA